MAKGRRQRIVAERQRILAAYRAGTPERVARLTGSGGLDDLPAHVVDFAEFFEKPGNRSGEELERATDRAYEILVPILRATLPAIASDAMAEHDAWRKRLEQCGLDDVHCTGIIDPAHARLARDREAVHPRRLHVVLATPERDVARAAA